MHTPSLLAITTLGLLAGADPDSTGDRVAAFARAQIGQRVGEGVCSSLVTEALRHAGALPFSLAEPLPSIDVARPGDILEFDAAEFEGQSTRNRVRRTWRYTFDDHVAIVSRVTSRGATLRLSILHQNYGFDQPDPEKRKVVSQMTLDLADLRKGQLRAFRPVDRPAPAAAGPSPNLTPP